MFTVVATTVTCMFFVDMAGVATKAGLRAAGVLVLLLNACFLLLMMVLIARAGYSDAWAFAHRVWNRITDLWQRLLALCGCYGRERPAMYDGNNGRARVSHRPSTEGLVGGLQMSHRASGSTELLRNTVFSRSGTIVENGDSYNLR